MTPFQKPHLIQHNIKLEVLSPIHIGCGMQKHALEYITLNSKLYFLSDKKIFQLFQKLKPENWPAYLETFKAFATQKQSSLASKNGYKKLSEYLGNYRGEPLLENHLLVADCADDKMSYPISMFVHDYQGYYIPGSSIKGALRTLLLKACMLAENITPYAVIDKDDAKKQSTDLEETYFGKTLDSLMRGIRVSDSCHIANTHMRVQAVKFLPNKTLRNGKPGSDIPLHQVVLAPKANAKCDIRFTITLDIPLLEKNVKGLPACVQALLPLETPERILPLWLEKILPKVMQQELKNPLMGFAKIPSPEASHTPNFYLGANVGFDRHTLWDAEQVSEKTKLLPPLPKGKQDNVPPARNPLYAPQKIRAVEEKRMGETHYKAYGWCKLTVVDA